MTILIVGGGIGGLTLALHLHRRGIACRVFEAAPEVRPLGVGINLLPHAMRELTGLGLLETLSAVAIETREMAFFNRFGQHIYSDPRGRFAGYDWPQISIHRGDLQLALLAAVRERLGPDAVLTGHRFVAAEQDDEGVTARFVDPAGGVARPPVRGAALIGCDGVRSAVRDLLHPDGGGFVYSGVTMWRGVTRWMPILTGASMISAGWLATGKMVIYPIRNAVDGAGRQLVNWLCEVEVPPRREGGDWVQEGRLEDFLWACRDMRFDWLDVPAFVSAADAIYEYPMVDKDPLDRWSVGRMTLLGDAAHPMYPRGSNGAGQAILDARVLSRWLAETADPAAALRAYEAERLEAANRVVLTNRTNPPDAILRTVYERTGDRPFARIEDVVTRAEFEEHMEAYKRVAGFDKNSLR